MSKRDNGTGTIRKVKGANGVRFYAYAPAKYTCDPNGDYRCVREALGGFRTRSEARTALEEYARHPLSKYNYTLADIYESWKGPAFSDITKATQDNYTAAWAQICAAAPDTVKKQIREITTSDLRQILDFWTEEHEISVASKDGKQKKKKAGPLSLSSLTKIKALLTQLYDYSLANNIIDKNYASLVKIPKGIKAGTKRAFTDAEFAILEKNWKTVPGGDAVYALCYLGFRVSEFCQLTPASYDSGAQTLKGGLKTEAGRDRLVPVHPNISGLVQKWASAGQEALYADASGKPYNKDRFTRNIWKPAIKALGLPDDLTPHSARHTCGTRLSAAGARPEDIQAILGHADYSVTANTYINQDVAALRESMARMS